MNYDSKNICWFVLFAANGKAIKIVYYLKTANIEYFFPMHYQEKRIKDSKLTKCSLQPILRNFVFVRSSKECLDPLLKEVKLQLGIKSDLYYRDLGNKRQIVVPETEMQNFIIIARSAERIIYFPNEEVNLKKGTRVRIISGVFEGLEGIFVRVKGDRRVVVSLPELFSVATAFIPLDSILPLE